MGKVILLSLLLLLVLYANFFLLPRIEEVRLAMGDEFAQVGSALRSQWGSLHGLSMGLNLITLVGAIAAGIWLAF